MCYEHVSYVLKHVLVIIYIIRHGYLGCLMMHNMHDLQCLNAGITPGVTINLPGLKTLDILIMFIGCPRHYMGLSKPQELGMSVFGTSSLRRASPLRRSTPHYSPRRLMERSSFVKYMLMISSLDHQMKILAKSLVN